MEFDTPAHLVVAYSAWDSARQQNHAAVPGSLGLQDTYRVLNGGRLVGCTIALLLSE